MQLKLESKTETQSASDIEEDSRQFTVIAISNEDLNTFQETIEANDVLEAQMKFQEMWPLATVTSIQKA